MPKNHTGLDIFAEKGTNLYACLDGTVERIYGEARDNGYAIVLVIELDSVDSLKNSQNNYIINMLKKYKKAVILILMIKYS